MNHISMRSLALFMAAALAACVGDTPDAGDDFTTDPSAADRTNDDEERDEDEDDRDEDEQGDSARDAGAARDAGGRVDASRDAATDARDEEEDEEDEDEEDDESAGMSRSDAGRDAASGDAGSDAETPASGASRDDVPDSEHCEPAADWSAEAAQFEEEVLELTNAARAVGHNCDTMGNFGPAPALKTQPNLRCAARLHSKYMADNMEFSHTQSATGLDPFKRMQQAGYQFRLAGENIAYGQRTPEQVVQGWLDSDGHCANIMNPRFTELGVGYFVGAAPGGRGARLSPYWTQKFGQPR